jgi:CheY-like chemotaxis protein
MAGPKAMNGYVVEGKGTAAAAHADDMTLAFVVSRSRVNAIVVSRIVERTGLRAELLDPEEALAAIEALQPATVILDGGAGNDDCAALYDHLRERRLKSSRNLPGVILLATEALAVREIGGGKTVDAVVTKPITLEALQPLIGKLVAMARR